MAQGLLPEDGGAEIFLNADLRIRCGDRFECPVPGLLRQKKLKKSPDEHRLGIICEAGLCSDLSQGSLRLLK